MTLTRPPLRLMALDSDDVMVISATLQDAILRPDDLKWDRRRRELSFTASRLMRETKGAAYRRRCALHIADVLSVQSRGLEKLDDHRFINLLAMTVAMDEVPPAATIGLEFSGGFSMAIKVEAIDVRMMDTETAWRTSRVPDHSGRDDTQ